MALVAGFFGGLSGIWGPPLVMYLLALELPKTEMVRAQSLSFLLGSAVLFVAHLHSGVLESGDAAGIGLDDAADHARRCSSATGCTTGWTSGAS